MVDLLQWRQCGAFTPMWLDLNGSQMPDVGQRVEAQTCSWYLDVECCAMPRVPVTVLNCLDFFVYLLGPTYNYTISAYCAIASN